MVTEESSQSLKKIKGNKDDVNKEEKNETVRHQIKSIKDSTIKKLNGDIDLMIDEMMKEIHTNNGSKDPHSYLNNNIEHQTRRTKTGKILDKEYIARNSPLDDLFKAKHIETIYHIAITFLIIYFTNTTISDFRKTGTVDLGFSLMAHGFNNISSVIGIWAVMTFSVFIVCPTFKFWATVRVQMTPKSQMVKIWDHFWVAVFCLYFALFLAIPAKFTFLCQLKAPSAMVILMEQTRYLMKMYAFVRSNAPRVIAYKPHATDTILHPSFEQYLYFLFIPALVYKDQYPRTKSIRWNVVFWSFSEVFIIIMLHGILFGKVIFPKFENFGKEKMHYADLCIAILESAFPAICIYVSGFYLILHCWMNAWAELMRFADRLFYQDWWNSTSYSQYYRLWNVVVHDWLYTYVYKDTLEHTTSGKRSLSMIAVFMLSAVFHEYILTVVFGFFYPIMFISFGGIGVICAFINTSKHKALGNVFFWWSLSIGNSWMIVLYTVEYFARQNCPDWWNTAAYKDFYRVWNVLVHDWLSKLVYQDILLVHFKLSQTMAKILVFQISAIIHEYILVFMLGFFFPVLYIHFGFFGTLFVFVNTSRNKTFGNFFMLISLFMGINIIICLYTIEHFARINCPLTRDPLIDFFIPRSFSCNAALN